MKESDYQRLLGRLNESSGSRFWELLGYIAIQLVARVVHYYAGFDKE